MPSLSPSYHVFHSIGIIRTPYKDSAPFQPVEAGDEVFRLVLDPRYAEGLHQLQSFRYLYVIYALDRIRLRPASLTVRPPWAPGMHVGVFASRSPNRPNPLGISVVRIKEIRNNVIYIGGIDAFDGTPILDIKPYLKDLDAKCDANYGWVGETGDEKHLALHIKGIPHKHD